MNAEFLDALRQIEKEKDIPLEVLLSTIESALETAYRKNFAATGDVRVRVSSSKGGFHVYCEKEVVEEVLNAHTQVALKEARVHDPKASVGDTIEVEVTPENFGRIAAQTAKQVVVQRIREAERDKVYEDYRDRLGEIVTCTVQRRDQRNVVVNLGKVEGILPPGEQVPTEPYRFNDRIKVYILDVRRTTKGPQIVVSRTHPSLIRRLFEFEVPEIAEGVVSIMSVAREPGARTKVAVQSSDDKVDAMGACVGHRGTRVQSIVNELYGEKIDIVRWNDRPDRFIAEALSPAKVVTVTCDEEAKSALVIVPDSQLSLAIGKSGQNVRLAARLTGWRIDIRSEAQIARVQEDAAGVEVDPQPAPAVDPEEIDAQVATVDDAAAIAAAEAETIHLPDLESVTIHLSDAEPVLEAAVDETKEAAE